MASIGGNIKMFQKRYNEKNMFKCKKTKKTD